MHAPSIALYPRKSSLHTGATEACLHRTWQALLISRRPTSLDKCPTCLVKHFRVAGVLDPPLVGVAAVDVKPPRQPGRRRRGDVSAGGGTGIGTRVSFALRPGRVTIERLRIRRGDSLGDPKLKLRLHGRYILSKICIFLGEIRRRLSGGSYAFSKRLLHEVN